MAKPHACPACTGPSVVIPHVTIPNAAEVSATVARQWHLGLAEDAKRRRRRYLHEWARTITEDKPRACTANRLRDYFRTVAKKHRKAAEKGLTQ